MATKDELVDQVHAALMRHADTLTRNELLTLVSDLTFSYAYKLTSKSLRNWKAKLDALNGANNGVMKE